MGEPMGEPMGERLGITMECRATGLPNMTTPQVPMTQVPITLALMLPPRMLRWPPIWPTSAPAPST